MTRIQQWFKDIFYLIRLDDFELAMLNRKLEIAQKEIEKCRNITMKYLETQRRENSTDTSAK